VPSLRARRGLLAFLATALSLSIMLWLIGGPAGWQFQQPGPLTFQHGTVTHSCEACHAIPLERPVALFDSMLRAHDPLVQNHLCLKCHDLGGQPALPHGLSPAQLAALRHNTGQRTGRAPLAMAAAQQLLGTGQDADGALRCGTCHQEHQGANFNLSAMDNQRCQACHTQQFASLADGHPEFRDYPLRQRPPIFFDHESHFGRHFKDFHAQMPAGVAPHACMDCHTPDARQRMMLLQNFDRSCASCHLPQIMDTALGGVPFLNLPGLDADTLRRYEVQSAAVNPLAALSTLPLPVPTVLPALATVFRDPRLVVQPPFAIGAWPAAAAGDLTPFMQLLLSASPEYVAARATLRGVPLRDLRQATPEQIAAVGVLVWSIKELFYDVIQQGDDALTRRLERLTVPPPSEEQLTLLVADLPPGSLRLAVQRWLPSLLTEVQNRRAGLPLTAGPGPQAVAPITLLPHGRWQAHDEDCSFHYLPRRHTDLFLQNWLDLAGQQYASARQPAFATVFDQLSSPYSPGRCGKCHSVDAAGCRLGPSPTSIASPRLSTARTSAWWAPANASTATSCSPAASSSKAS